MIELQFAPKMDFSSKNLFLRKAIGLKLGVDLGNLSGPFMVVTWHALKQNTTKIAMWPFIQSKAVSAPYMILYGQRRSHSVQVKNS